MFCPKLYRRNVGRICKTLILHLFSDHSLVPIFSLFWRHPTRSLSQRAAVEPDWTTLTLRGVYWCREKEPKCLLQRDSQPFLHSLFSSHKTGVDCCRLHIYIQQIKPMWCDWLLALFHAWPVWGSLLAFNYKINTWNLSVKQTKTGRYVVHTDVQTHSSLFPHRSQHSTRIAVFAQRLSLFIASA